MHLNLTQIIGSSAFFAAGLMAMRAAFSTPAGHRAQVWWLVGYSQVLFGLEVIVGVRHQLHDGVDAVLRSTGLYPIHATIQTALLVACALCLSIGRSVLGRWMAGIPALTRHTKRAAYLTLAVAALFMVESVSLHTIDSVVYAEVGPVRAITFLWVTAALAMIAIARDELRQN